MLKNFAKRTKLSDKAVDTLTSFKECFIRMSNDELQKKLNNAKAQQQEYRESRSRDPRIVAERKKYQTLYNRIYPFLLRSDFDFAEVAEVTRLKERRLRDALLSRLALDNLVYLLGHQQGSCYACGLRIRSIYQDEPLCLPCLQSIEAAINSLYAPEPLIQNKATKMSMPEKPLNNLLEDMLACGVPLLAITGEPIHSRPEVLRILDKADEESDGFDEIAALLQLDKPTGIGVRLYTDLRRFGFQRVKPTD